MNKPCGEKPGSWDRMQRIMLGLVTLANEAAKLIDALRSIIR